MQKIPRKWTSLFISIFVLLMSLQTVSAAGVSMSLITTWLPTEQLSSPNDVLDLDENDTFVDLQFYVQGNVQFWAVDFECFINNGGVFDTSHTPEMVWGPAWQAGNSSPNYFEGVGNGFNPATNAFNASATRIGATNTSLGLGGATYNLLLFSYRLYLKDTIVGTQNVSVSCKRIAFLDRNGSEIGKKLRQSNISNLTIRDGYVISGKASRQGNNNKGEIKVDCEHIESGNDYSDITDGNGNFTFDKALGDTDPLRDYGLYECTYSSLLGGSEQTVYLHGATYLNLQTPRYNLLPVVLRSGDTEQINSQDEINIDNDLPLITGNWLLTNQTPFTNGDVNGDGNVNQNDLVIAAGNVGLTENVPMDHVLYSAGLDYGSPFPNSQIWLGDRFSGAVSGFMIGKNQRLFMPQMSPDGSKIAFVSATIDKKTKANFHTVLISSSSAFKPLNIFGKKYIGQDFSPSWSPDGNTLAYICSWSSTIDGYQINNGNLCIVGANGNPASNKIIPAGQLQSYAKIFPPTWYDSNVVVYGGNEDSSLCSNQLCYYDMANDIHGRITISGVDGTTTKADMPSLVHYYNGATFLIYRFRSDSTTELRMATVSYSAGSWTGGIQSGNGTNLLHETVDGSSGVAYYDVSHMLDIMFYKFQDFAFTNLYFSSNTQFAWATGETHMLDGIVGYPTASIPDGFGVWDESDSLGTEFHVYKPTFDWLP